MARIQPMKLNILFVLSFLLFAGDGFAREQHKFSGPAVELTSSNLPIIIINTDGLQIMDEERITAFMGIIDNGSGQRNNIMDPYNGYDGAIAIELRGSSSGSYPKKQYRLETQDENGENLNVSLLGMPSENDWILYGPYDDQTLIRNVFAYRLSAKMGRYASRTRYCELVLNDEYRGLYVLMEKLKRDRNRINIKTLDSADSSGIDVTGGYILKIDKWAGENVAGWKTETGVFIQYDYPKTYLITDPQKTYISEFIDQFEKAMAKDWWQQATPEYAGLIDDSSFVDHFILNEICKNVDAYRISAFMFKNRDDEDGRLNAGPVWDFNLSLGNAWYPSDLWVTEGWQVDYRLIRPWDGYQVPWWWEKLAHDSVFEKKAAERWHSLRTGILSKDSLFASIDQLVLEIEEPRVRNFQKWPADFEGSSYEALIQKMKDWLSARIDWIDINIESLADIEESYLSRLSPNDINLHQNYPNPFNQSTRINFEVKNGQRIQLKIYTINGREIITLNDSFLKRGSYSIFWPGINNKKQAVATGIYYYRLSGHSHSQIKKMIIVR